MEQYSIPHITHVERLSDAITITYADGTCALYSHFLLHAMLDQAQRITLDPELDDSADPF